MFFDTVFRLAVYRSARNENITFIRGKHARFVSLGGRARFHFNKNSISPKKYFKKDGYKWQKKNLPLQRSRNSI
jgi:hypothetical protein